MRGLRFMPWAVLALSMACGCGTPVADPRPQWRVTIGTDAPIPQLGDRLLIEVFDEDGNACTGCRRQLGADDPAQWPFSFGVVPPEDGGARVRARLYRTAITGSDGAPGSNRALDALVRLPEASGVTDVAIPLVMRCFGVAADVASDTSCDPETGVSAKAPTLTPFTGSPSLPAPNDWPDSADVDCPPPAPPGMVCIPGGAFLLGDPDYLPTGELDSVPEQLVRVSPFWLDAGEVTVKVMRELVASGKVKAPLAQGAGATKHCTYAETGNDSMPVNCLSRAAARAACEARGMRLPTEAEWEFAAGNRRNETPYPWGAGAPCSNAWVGRGEPMDIALSSACASGVGDAIGPVAVGSTPEDTTALGVSGLGGNVSEWVDDDLMAYSDPACWGPSAMLHVDPKCQGGASPAIRGGSWGSLPVAARATSRNAAIADGPSPLTGFRCAK